MTRHAGIPLAVVGCDFRVAPSRARSRLVLDEPAALALADELERGGWADGLAVLDTCNRNEWIVASDQPAWAAQLLHGRMIERLGPDAAHLDPYVHVGDEAARHLFRVALGQESLVLGERQISGQLFEALHCARTRGTSTRSLNGLGSIAGRLVRIAMRERCLGGSAVGVHSLAIAWLRQRLPPGPATVAVVGMGSIGRRVAGILDEDPRFRVVRCNRTVAPDAGVRPLSDLPAILGEVDAAVVCTAAPRPLLDPTQLGGAAPLVLVDIGIPEQVADLPGAVGVRRVGLDQLVDWHLSQGARDAQCGASCTPLVDRAVCELRRYCAEPPFTPVFERVRASSSATSERLGTMLQERLPQASATERSRLEAELRALLAGFTDDVLLAIRDGARQLTEAKTWSEE